jgi:hypothetical protein
VSILPWLSKVANRLLIALKLPLDIDEETVVLEDFCKALPHDPNLPASPPTTLTEFIHNVRIGQNIQHEIYRVDQRANPSHDIIDGFLSQLSSWREAVPLEDIALKDNAIPSQIYGSQQFSNINDRYAS